MGIHLHNEKGVNPRLTFCPRCGGEGKEIVLLGTKERVYTCSECGGQNFGGFDTSMGRPLCGVCGCDQRGNKDFRVIAENEKIPGSMCASCEKELKEYNQIVADGGVHFKCNECGAQGVIKSEAPFAMEVRKHHGEEYSEKQEDGTYKACGVAFDHCAEHGGRPDDE